MPVFEHTFNVTCSRFGPKRCFYKATYSIWMKEITLNFITSPAKPLQTAAGNLGLGKHRPGIAITKFETRQIFTHQSQRFKMLE